MLELADGKRSREETEELVSLRTRQFARRQRTWFRSLEGVRWMPAPGDVERALDFLGWR